MYAIDFYVHPGRWMRKRGFGPFDSRDEAEQFAAARTDYWRVVHPERGVVALGRLAPSDDRRVQRNRETARQIGERKGGQEHWYEGETAYFEYHCNQSHDSEHAEWWYRSQQPVTILEQTVSYPGTAAERGEGGTPNCYRVKWADGFKGEVFEDELLTSPVLYDKTWKPGIRPNSEATTHLAEMRDLAARIESFTDRPSWNFATMRSVTYLARDLAELVRHFDPDAP